MQDRATPRRCGAAEVSAERIARGRQSVGRAGGDTAFRCLDNETTGSPVKSITKGLLPIRRSSEIATGDFCLRVPAHFRAKRRKLLRSSHLTRKPRKTPIARPRNGSREHARSRAGGRNRRKSSTPKGSASRIIYPGTRVVVALVTNWTGADWKREEVEAVAEKFADVRK
jgi:hypothetical protein